MLLISASRSYPSWLQRESSTSLLPPALAQIQFVDYQQQDRNSALRLARAFAAVPPPGPLPDPLPPLPEAPLSYLGGLTEKVELTSTLSYEQQSALLVDLKSGLRDPETTDDARTLLVRLRKRRDLLATIAYEIDELLTSTKKPVLNEPEPQMTRNVEEAFVKTPPATGGEASRAKMTQPSTAQPAPAAVSNTMTLSARLKSAGVGAIVGSAVGIAAMIMTAPNGLWQMGLVTGAGGAIAGAISGTDRRLIFVALLGAAIGWFLVFRLWGFSDPFAAGAVFGAPVGAILGAITGVILRKMKLWV